MGQSITSANSVVTLTVPGLYDTPVTLKNYAADRAFDTDGVETAEVVMSIDGFKSAGYRPVPISQNFHLAAPSDSADIFDAIYRAEKAQREKLSIYMTITLPAVKKSYTMKNGTLTNYKPMADAGTVLQARDFTIVWESFDNIPI